MILAPTMEPEDVKRLWELAILSVAGLVGALGTYFGSLLLDKRSRDRRRRATATALLAELAGMRHALTVAAERWEGQNLELNYRRPGHDAFVGHVDLFKPDTVRAVLRFMSHIVDLEEWVREHRALTPGPERDRVFRNVKRFAGQAIAEADRARELLEGEGGEWEPYSVTDFDRP